MHMITMPWLTLVPPPGEMRNFHLFEALCNGAGQQTMHD